MPIKYKSAYELLEIRANNFLTHNGVRLPVFEKKNALFGKISSNKNLAFV